MAKKISQRAKGVPSLTDLTNEYNLYGAPYLRWLLAQIKNGVTNQQSYCERIAKGLHPINATRVNATWLRFCVINQNQLSKLKTSPRNSHQKCISSSSINGFVSDLQNSNILNKSYNDFEQLYADVNSFKKSGLGDLFIYDATLRIGFAKQIFPSKYVYLHSGALEGAKILAKRGFLNLRRHTSAPAWKVYGYHRIPTTEFSNILPGMNSIDIENFLCIAKQYFLKMIVP